MKKNTMMQILVSLVACFLLIACINPMSGGEETVEEGKGLITISIGGKSARKALSWAETLDSTNLVHTITVSDGPGTAPAPQTIPAGGGSGTAQFSVTPGQWTITVEGSLASGEVVALGSEPVQINQGNNGTIAIQMKKPSDFPSYTVRFTSNGGSSVANQTVNRYDKAASVTPTKKGFGFGGWYSDPSLAADKKYDFLSAVTTDLDLYARWSTNFFTVTFIEGTSTRATQDIAEPDDQVDKVYASDPGIIRKGYKDEWYKESTFTTLWDFNRDPVTGNMSLYLKWEAEKYDVILNDNPGSGGPTKVIATYDDAMPAIASTSLPTREGYNFAGYFDAASGGKQYYNDDGSSALNWDKDTDYTLRAQWSAKEVVITLNPNGGTPAGNSTITGKYYDGTMGASLPTTGYALTGHTFQGWSASSAATSADFTGTTKLTTANGVVDNTPAVTKASLTLYAVWTADSYTITFDRQGATDGSASVSATYGAAMPTGPSVTAPTKTGYDFGGYWTAANGGGTQYYTATMGSATNSDFTGATTLYAKWTAISNIQVSFSADGGLPAPSNISVTYNSQYGTLPTVTKTGYSFVGWYAESALTNQVTSTTTVTNASTHTLYAKWILNVAITNDAIGVTFPVIGASPATDIATNAQYTGSIAWSPNHTTFAAGTVYTATITLTPVSGYTLTGVAADFFTVAGGTEVANSANSGSVTAKFYTLGATGPGGGKIFYNGESDPAGFTLYTSATDTTGTKCYYLEAASNDAPSSVTWSSGGYDTSDITGTDTALGKGRKNTAIILGIDANAPAAKYCRDYTGGSKSDWFLPSFVELLKLYGNITYVDNIATHYWSSSQNDASHVMCVFMTSGMADAPTKNGTNSVRPIRAF